MKRLLVLRHDEAEPLGNLETVLCAGGLELETVDCFAPSWPQVARRGFDPARFGGLVVMGGPMSIHQTDRYPFLATEIEWLRAAVGAQLPTLGICLGSQMLAAALGARVYANPIKEIGWYRIELLPAAGADPLLGGSQACETVFQWHGQTFDLPPGAVHLASSKDCRQQAFRHGASAYGLQFHPEMTAEMVDLWLRTPGMCEEVEELDYIDAETIRRDTPDALAAMTPFATRVFQGFGKLCRTAG